MDAITKEVLSNLSIPHVSFEGVAPKEGVKFSLQAEIAQSRNVALTLRIYDDQDESVDLGPFETCLPSIQIPEGTIDIHSLIEETWAGSLSEALCLGIEGLVTSNAQLEMKFEESGDIVFHLTVFSGGLNVNSWKTKLVRPFQAVDDFFDLTPNS
jgi:hypothetical protein